MHYVCYTDSAKDWLVASGDIIAASVDERAREKVLLLNM
jgi:hypothetical protein